MKNLNALKSLMLLLSLILLTRCSKRDSILLYRFNIPKSDVDTIRYFKTYDVYLLNVIDYGFLGHFKNQFVFSKSGHNFGYKIDAGNLTVRSSKKYLGLVKAGSGSYGWFFIKDHKESLKLPGIDSIDSILTCEYPGLFIQESNGLINIIDKGKTVNRKNYGDFYTKEHKINYDVLEYGLYKLKDGKLLKVTSDVSKIMEQNDGIYFVPSPGLGAVVVKKMDDILSEINRVNKLNDVPKKIEI